MKLLFLLLFVLIFIPVSCTFLQQVSEKPFTRNAVVPPTATPLPTPVEWNAITTDGISLLGLWYPGNTTHTLLYVHDYGSNAASWEKVIRMHQREGYSIMALDLRGHGGSSDWNFTSEDDWYALTEDVRTAMLSLRERGIERIDLIGKGVGANIVLITASGNPTIDHVILVDPSSSLNVTEAAAAYTQSLLLITSSTDEISRPVAEQIYHQSAAKKDIQYYVAAARSEEQIGTAILQWLRRAAPTVTE